MKEFLLSYEWARTEAKAALGYLFKDDEYPRAEVLARHCADTGRDPDTVERSSGVEGKGADALVANAEALAQLGVTLMTVGCDGPDYNLGPAEALVRWRDNRSA